LTIRVAVIGLAAVCAAYLALWLSLDALPLLDFPNHLARATILGDLWLDGGRRFGTVFDGEVRFAPYILGDLILAPLTQWLPPDVAGRLWLAVLFLALPASVYAFLRAFGCRGWQLLVGTAVAVFLATDWFFVVGFGAFRLGVTLSLLTLAAWRCCIVGQRAWYAVYALLVLGCYLAHLASFVMVGVAAGVLSLLELRRRRVSFVGCIALGAPFVALIAHYALLGSGETRGAMTLVTVGEKVFRLGAPFVRFDVRVDLLLAALLPCALAAAALGSPRRRDVTATPAGDFLALAGIFLLLYAAMPVGSGTVYDIDVRALPFAVLFGVFAAVARIAPDRPPRSLAVAALVLLLVGNLVYLGAFLLPENARAREYRRVVATLPEGTPFLPIVTVPAIGRTQPLLHAYAWATIDRGAIAPYLFSANRRDSMIYFRYRRRTVEPYIFWYVRNGAAPDWPAVAHDYPFVVVTEPVDLERIGVEGEWRVRTPVASVLAVSRARARPSAEPRTAEARSSR
jgi:hypothetical protein